MVVDRDAALRSLMRRSLESVGYDIVEASGDADLADSLSAPELALADHALVVSAHSIAVACREALTAAARRRVDAGLPPVSLLLTCEFGTVEGCAPLEPPGCVAAGLLEKPFDFVRLQSLADPFHALAAGPL